MTPRSSSPFPEAVTTGVQTLAVAVGAALVIVLILLIVVPIFCRRALRAACTLNEASQDLWRERVLDVVRENSPSKGTQVRLSKWWRSSGLSTADRFVVLEPLIIRGILSRAYSSDKLVSFFQTLSWGILSRPPAVVILSEREWTQLATGTKSSVIIEKLVHNEVSGVSGGTVTIGNRNRIKQIQSITPEFVETLIDALRVDAKTLPQAESEQAESFADSLEADVRKGRMSSALKVVRDVVDVAAKAVGAWATTHAALSGN